MSEKKNLTTEETFALAVQNHQKNNLHVAENLYKEILKTNPNHAMAHSNLGNVLLELGKYQKAIKIAERLTVMGCSSRDALPYFNASEHLASLNK